MNNAGQGGAVTIRYSCNGCVSQMVVLEMSSRYELGNTNEVSIAVQVKHALGIDAIHWYDFQCTIEMYPIVKIMLDQVCESAKDDI